MERINPKRMFFGALVPNWLARQPAVSSNAKLAYARLAQFATDNDGVAWPTLEQLGSELGWSTSTVQRALRELERLRLVEAEQVGLNRPNRYYFLEHPWIRRRSENERIPDRSDVTTPDRSDPAGLDRSDVTTPLRKEVQGSESKAPPSPPSTPPGEGDGYREARGVVDGWWDRQDPKPIGVGKTTIAKRVQKLVGAGWPLTLVAEALDAAESFTEAALEGRLRYLRRTGSSGGVAEPLAAAGGLVVPILEFPPVDQIDRGDLAVGLGALAELRDKLGRHPSDEPESP